MKPLISIVVTVYDLTEIEKDNWIFIGEQLREKDVNNKIQYIILNDNPEKDEEYKNLFINFEYKSFGKNLGKYQLVKTAADKGLIKGRWAKFCDPDDIILVDSLLEFAERAELLKDNPVIRLQYSRTIFSGDWSAREQKSLEIISSLRSTISLVNENSVIPVQDIIDFDLEAYNQTKSSDVLFALASSIKNTPVTVLKKPFYIYNFHKGISNEDKKNIVKDKNVKFHKELITFLKIMDKYKNQSTLKTPSWYDYKWAHNSILLKKKNYFWRVFYLSKVYSLLKKCSKDNINWGVRWGLLRKICFIYIFQLFRILI